MTHQLLGITRMSLQIKISFYSDALLEMKVLQKIQNTLAAQKLFDITSVDKAVFDGIATACCFPS